MRSAMFAAIVLVCGCSPAGRDDATNDNVNMEASELKNRVAEQDAQIASLKAELAEARKPTSRAEHSAETVSDSEIDPRGAAIVAEAVRKNAKYPDNCYKDYCPCEQPQEGMDSVLCDQLEAGLDVPIESMIAGRGFREARRQAAELGY